MGNPLKILMENLKGRGYLEALDIDGRMLYLGLGKIGRGNVDYN
jgi:hypothetical protein